MAQELILYCGKCDRQQQAKDGDLCKVCKSKTIIWASGDSASVVKDRWKKLYGN